MFTSIFHPRFYSHLLVQQIFVALFCVQIMLSYKLEYLMNKERKNQQSGILHFTEEERSNEQNK